MSNRSWTAAYTYLYNTHITIRTVAHNEPIAILPPLITGQPNYGDAAFILVMQQLVDEARANGGTISIADLSSRIAETIQKIQNQPKDDV